MSEELKPCPFCGCDDLDATKHRLSLITCQNCGTEALEKRWNTRPIEDALRQEITDLRHRLEVMTKERERWRSNSGHLRTQLERLRKQLPDEPMDLPGDTL